jgi:hypothetical protein
MADINNIKIQLYDGSLIDYISAESLGIKFSRIADNFNDPSKKYGDFSYTFNLPKTKNNDRIFEFPDAKGRTGIFNGKSFECRVFNNNELLLDGIIELTTVNRDSYGCNFYSNFTLLVDELKDKNLKDLKYDPINIAAFSNNVERFIVSHINADYENSDEADFQFPLIKYTTFFSPDLNFSDREGNSEIAKENRFEKIYNNYRNFIIPATEISNGLYFHQLPPAFYLVFYLKKIFEEAGFELSGSWINKSEIKRIIIPFIGDSIDRSGLYNPTNNTLNLKLFFLDIKQIDFLKNILLYFNLYIVTDFKKKTIKLESFQEINKLLNPYNITSKLDFDTVKKEKNNLDVILNYKENDNNNKSGVILPITTQDKFLLEFNNYIYFHQIIYNRYQIPFFDYYNTVLNINNLVNKNFGNKTINFDINVPNYNTILLDNYRNINNTTIDIDGFEFFRNFISIPILTVDTLNNAPLFFEEGENTYPLANRPDKMNYNGDMMLVYYYGRNVNQNKKWINVITGGTPTTPTFSKIYIPFSSPYLTNVGTFLDLFDTYINSSLNISDTFEVSAVGRTYYDNVSGSSTFYNTPYSLTLKDNSVYPNVYSEYHKDKYSQLATSNILKAKMRMDENDWREMTIDRLVEFDDEYYRIIAIKNYDPINRTADIELIKKT